MKVPFSTFSTYVVGTPSVKLASVSNFKQGYDIKNDYWKRPREAIPRNHQDGNVKSGLDDFMKKVADSSKASNFAERIAAYKKWWGTNKIDWTGGSTRTWSAAGIQIGISPELFISINGVPHVVRLYFNKDKLPKDRANILIRLMEIAYHKGAAKPAVGVLDLGQGKLITAKGSLTHLDPLLVGEAASFAAVYNSL